MSIEICGETKYGGYSALDSTGAQANADKDARIAELEGLFQNIWMNIEGRETLGQFETRSVQGIIASALKLTSR